MKATRWTAIIASTLTLAASACAGNAAYQSQDAGANPDPTPRAVAVTVQNDNFWDMKIYALVNGNVRIRLGTVTGNHHRSTVDVPDGDAATGGGTARRPRRCGLWRAAGLPRPGGDVHNPAQSRDELRVRPVGPRRS